MDKILFYLILLFLPTQFGKHFWPQFSYILGARVDYLSPTLYFTDILIVLLFIFWMVSFVKNQKSPVRQAQGKSQKYLAKPDPASQDNSKLKIILPLVLFLAIGIFFSKNPMTGWYGMIKFLEFLFFGYYISETIKTMKQWRTITAVFSLGVFFESALAMLQYINQSSIGSLFYFLGERSFSAQTPGIANAGINGELILRPYGTFSHPNVLAAYLIVGMTIIIFNLKFLIFNQFLMPKFKNIFSGIVLLLGSITLFLAMSRVAIILWLVIAGFYLIKYFRRPVLLISFLLFLISAILLSPAFSRFSEIGFSQESFLQRKELIIASFSMLSNYPLLGVGLNNFLVNLPYFYKVSYNSLFSYLQPVHNIYLLIAAQTGLVGLGFFAWFIGKALSQISNFPAKQDLASQVNFQLNLNVLKFKFKNSFQISNFKFQILSLVLVLGFFDHYFLTIQQGQLLFSFVMGLCFAKVDGKIKRGNN